MGRVNDMITEECQPYEFVNLGRKRTGIENVIIRVYYGGKKVIQGPKVKVSNVYNLFLSSDNFAMDVGTLEAEGVVKISSDELEKVQKWVRLNTPAIHRFWHHGDELVTDRFLDTLKKIE